MRKYHQEDRCTGLSGRSKLVQPSSGMQTVVAYNGATGTNANYSGNMDYGHIVGNNEGGGGRLPDRNGFPQNRGINRGQFRDYQASINSSVTPTNNVHTYTQRVYANGGGMPTSVNYSTDRTGTFSRTTFLN